VKIGDRIIGKGLCPYVVADISASHNGSLDRGLALIDAAKAAGADAVKFQAYLPELVSCHVDRPEFIIQGGPWKGMHLYELYQDAYTPRQMLQAFFGYAREIGITAFSTACANEDVDFLETLDNPVIKIASMDIVNLPLIDYAASKRRPLIISTGMASEDEIMDAMDVVEMQGAEYLLLHCVSEYPCPLAKANIAGLVDLDCWAGPSGYSDHTLGFAAAVMATTAGATMIEKHLTLDAKGGGPDDHFATEPHEFKTMVSMIHDAHKAMTPVAAEAENPHKALRPSLYVVSDLKAGELFTPQSVRAIRPSFGLPPVELPAVLGCRASRDIARGEPLHWNMAEAA
jgi:N-acetylneuraminate synthase